MYTIRILNDKQFDALPYKYVKTALGCADAKTGVAYIRRTGIRGIDLLTIGHEVDELTAKISPHEVDGIRYKKMGHELAVIGATILGSMIGGPVGGTMAAMGAQGVVSAQSGASAGDTAKAMAITGATTYAGTKVPTKSTTGPGEVYPGVSGVSSTGHAALAANTAEFSAPTSFGTSAGLAPVALNAGATGFNTSTVTPTPSVRSGDTYPGEVYPGVSGVSDSGHAAIAAKTAGLSTPTSVSRLGEAPSHTLLGGTARTGSTNMALQQFGSGGGPQPPDWNSTLQEETKKVQPSSWATSIMKKLTNPMTLAGLATMAASGSLPISPPVPELGPTASKWLQSDTVTRSGEKARAVADVKYLGDFKLDPDTMGMVTVMQDDIKKAYKLRRKEMDRMGAAANQFWMTSGERLEMHRRMDQDEQKELTSVEKELIYRSKTEHATRQYNYIINQLSADEKTKRDLLYADISEVMWKYNMKREDVMNFRKIAADAGMYLLKKGLDSGQNNNQ